MSDKIDPFNYQPVTNPKPSVAVPPAPEVEQPEALPDLSTLSRDELEALCRRMACQNGLAARMTREETAQAMLDVLAETALKPIVMGLNMKADIQSRMTAIDKWLDRAQGKAVQRVEQKIEHSAKGASSELTNDQLIEALRSAQSQGLLPGGAKLLGDGTVVIDAEYVEVKTSEE